MNRAETLARLTCPFARYYTLREDGVAPPFAAEGEFHAEQQQYFLTKRAVLSQAQTHEYVYFALADRLGEEELAALAEEAWRRGQARITPGPQHRSSDITLVAAAEVLSPGAKAAAAGLRRSRSYRFTLYGWSHFRVVAQELSTGDWFCNRQGRSLRKLLCQNAEKKEGVLV